MVGPCALVAVGALGMVAARPGGGSKKKTRKSRVTKCASANGAHCAEYKDELLATVKA